jgi:hypothetical protein
MPEEQFHDGLIAAWWSQSEGGPEIDYYRRTIERGGEPGARCGLRVRATAQAGKFGPDLTPAAEPASPLVT